MITRKSKMCLPWCKEKGCYDSYEKRFIGGKWFWVWVSHCKAADKMHKKILGKYKGRS